MDLEENEIKVEYVETCEIDPLREEVFVSQKNRTLLDQDLCGNVIFKDVDEEPLKVHLNNSQNIEKNDTNTQENYPRWFQSKDINGKLICKFCDLKYSTNQTLRHHVTNKHPDKAKALRILIINNKRDQKHICHICKKRFKNITEQKCHMDFNHPLESVQLSCMYCRAMFNNSDDLREHIHLKHDRKHNKFYTCNVCGYCTAKKSHYRQHSITHNTIKTLVCHYCDYKTNYLPNLKIHERIHTNHKPYRCNFKDCSYRSAAKSALRSHQLKHYPNENMVFCDKCSYQTVYKQSLKKHLDSHKRNYVRKKSKT